MASLNHHKVRTVFAVASPMPIGKGSALLVCLSLANLVFLRGWYQLESRYSDFFFDPPLPVQAALKFGLALLADIFILTGILWIAYVWACRLSPHRARRIIPLMFLVVLAIALNLIRTEFGLFQLSSLWVGGVLLCLALIAIRWHTPLFLAASMIVMWLWVLVPINIGLSVWHLATASTGVRPQFASRLPGNPPRRVVWIIFDEFDQELAFEARPAGSHLPNLDAFREKALYATNAHRAARNTLEAIPSLLLGQAVTTAKVIDAGRLTLTMADGTKQLFPNDADIFALVHSQNVNVAISGWFHPYCRMFAKSVTECEWEPALSHSQSAFMFLEPPVPGIVIDVMGSLVNNAIARFPGTDRFGFEIRPPGYAPILSRRKRQIIEYESIREAAVRFATDPSLGLVYLHFPVPHEWGIFNARGGQIEPAGDYVDNLALADRTLGFLRAAMEKAGIWDSSVVLVSADHSLRRGEEFSPSRMSPTKVPATPESPVIPFLLKMAWQETGLQYDKPFNALLTRDLLHKLMFGELADTEHVVDWLDSNPLRPEDAPVIPKK